VRSSDSRLLAVAACLLWSTAFLGVKTGLQYAPPLFFAGIRFMAAGLAVALVSRRKGYFHQVRRHLPLVLTVGFFQTFLLYGFFFLSLDRMRASTGAIVNGGGPLLTAVIAHFLLPGDRLSRRRFFSLMSGVAGMVLVTWSGGRTEGAAAGEAAGILLMIAGMTAGSLASVIVARSPESIDPFVLNSAQLIFGSSGLLAAAFLTGSVPSEMPPPIFFGALVWLIAVTGGGFSIWYYLLKVRKEPVSYITVWKFLIPVSGALISWGFIHNDSPTLYSLGGMVLTGFSIFLFYSDGRKAAGKKQPVLPAEERI